VPVTRFLPPGMPGEDAGAGRVLIRHKIGQSDLAAMAGVARENVSRVLSDWKRRDLVTRSSGFYPDVPVAVEIGRQASIASGH
jgi:Crp-like helix-turn-helix domain